MSGRWVGSNHGRARYGARDRGGWSRPGRRIGAAVTGPLVPELGALLATITKSDLVDQLPTSLSKNETPNITDCKLVGSYNWLNKKSPTILVPGAPPQWTPASKANKLPEDSGSYFRDQNAARYAVHVFQPTMEAILKQNPNFDLDEIDIVACGSTLGNLRRFIAEPEKGFRFIVEAIGSAVFLVRRENSPTQTIPAVHGYGHTFPEANTTWGQDVRNSESHQRILRYQFAGLSCLVRYEGDGYLPNLHHPSVHNGEDAGDTPKDIVESLMSIIVSPAPSDGKPGLTVETGGEIVPQSAIFDLKTRTARKEYTDVLRAELPRLWLAQIPNFVVGFHNSGVFRDVRVKDVRAEVSQWEREHKGDLKKLAALLKMLVAFAHGQPDGRFEVVSEGGEHGELELREVSGDVNCCISEAMRKRWIDNGYDKKGAEGEKSPKRSEHVLKEAEGEKDEEYWTGQERDEDGKSGEDDSGSEEDFTACSASCGYCGHCRY
ncbi:uncharacterized protein BDV17DRAFT_288430 [Aspergillus undulatus]|uniref:uncharacterized protein n=1 Tax=Aspergillus undulatus TaxID=1810928 RepID=UPI003CCCD6C4